MLGDRVWFKIWSSWSVEQLRQSLIARPLVIPSNTWDGWQLSGLRYRNASVGLEYSSKSMLPSFKIYFVSRKILDDTEISTLNLMVGWKELAKVMKRFTMILTKKFCLICSLTLFYFLPDSNAVPTVYTTTQSLMPSISGEIRSFVNRWYFSFKEHENRVLRRVPTTNPINVLAD